MKLVKNGVVVVITDKIHIGAYLSSGWKPVSEATPVLTTPKKQEVIKIVK